jgi:hypothetical protein
VRHSQSACTMDYNAHNAQFANSPQHGQFDPRLQSNSFPYTQFPNGAASYPSSMGGAMGSSSVMQPGGPILSCPVLPCPDAPSSHLRSALHADEEQPRCSSNNNNTSCRRRALTLMRPTPRHCSRQPNSNSRRTARRRRLRTPADSRMRHPSPSSRLVP